MGRSRGRALRPKRSVTVHYLDGDAPRRRNAQAGVPKGHRDPREVAQRKPWRAELVCADFTYTKRFATEGAAAAFVRLELKRGITRWTVRYRPPPPVAVDSAPTCPSSPPIPPG